MQAESRLKLYRQSGDPETQAPRLPEIHRRAERQVARQRRPGTAEPEPLPLLPVEPEPRSSDESEPGSGQTGAGEVEDSQPVTRNQPAAPLDSEPTVNTPVQAENPVETPRVAVDIPVARPTVSTPVENGQSTHLQESRSGRVRRAPAYLRDYVCDVLDTVYSLVDFCTG